MSSILHREVEGLFRKDVAWLMGRDTDASKTDLGIIGILVFDFELFIGEPSQKWKGQQLLRTVSPFMIFQKVLMKIPTAGAKAHRLSSATP